MQNEIRPRLAIFASGGGSLLKAIIQDGIPIALVMVDRKCPAFDIAEAAGIRTILMHREGKFSPSRGVDDARIQYTAKIERLLSQYSIEFVAMAGFMTVFAPRIFVPFRNRITNIHPSLLPDFKGEYAVRDTLAAGVKETGTTIHLATAKLDEGLILARKRGIPVLPNDTVDSLWDRIKIEERILYPKVLRKILNRLPPVRTGIYEKSLPLTRTTEAPQ